MKSTTNEIRNPNGTVSFGFQSDKVEFFLFQKM